MLFSANSAAPHAADTVNICQQSQVHRQQPIIVQYVITAQTNSTFAGDVVRHFEGLKHSETSLWPEIRSSSETDHMRAATPCMEPTMTIMTLAYLLVPDMKFSQLRLSEASFVTGATSIADKAVGRSK